MKAGSAVGLGEIVQRWGIGWVVEGLPMVSSME